jgi:membrane protein
MSEAKPTFLALLRRVYQRFSDDECPMMASSLAYYTTFSLPPLLVIVISLAGLVWGEDAVRGRIAQELRGIVGAAGVTQLETMMDAASLQRKGLLASTIGIVVLLFGATGVVVQMQYALNKIWHVKPDPRQGGVWQFVHKRILSFAMILAIAFLLIVSLVVTTAVAAFQERIGGWLPHDVSKVLLLTANFVVSLLVFVILFAAMFKWMPDVRIAWRDAALGAIVTAALFMVGKFLLGLYLGRQDPSAYGPAAALVLILIWIYYSSMIVFLGGEFIEVWAHNHGRETIPAAGAVRVDDAGNIQKNTAGIQA